jgi:hypothetical protein
MVRNYPKEIKWEEQPIQVKRREARNLARQRALKAGKVRKGDKRELDHIGFHPRGSLFKVPTKIVSQHKNRVRQPPHKSRSK